MKGFSEITALKSAGFVIREYKKFYHLFIQGNQAN